MALFIDLRQLTERCPERFVSDLYTAIGLAFSAKLGASSTAELNLPRLGDPDLRNRLNAGDAGDAQTGSQYATTGRLASGEPTMYGGVWNIHSDICR